MLIASNRIRILAQLARFIWMNVSVDAFVSLHPLGFGSMLSFINGLLPHQSDVSFRTFSWNQGKSHFHVTRGNCRNQYHWCVISIFRWDFPNLNFRERKCWKSNGQISKFNFKFFVSFEFNGERMKFTFTKRWTNKVCGNPLPWARALANEFQ